MKTALTLALLFALPGLAQEGNRAAPADELGLIALPFAQGFPFTGAEGVPTNTLIWTHGNSRLVGPEGEVPLTEVTRFSIPGAEETLVQDPGPLPANTQFTVLNDGDFELATFTTGDAAAESPDAPRVVNTEEFLIDGPVPVITKSRSLSVEVEFDGVVLFVEPDAESLDELTFAEQLNDSFFNFLSFPLDGPLEKRLFTVNAAGEMSEATVLTHEPGGCAQIPGELNALWPILGLLALRTRRNKARGLGDR